MRHAKAEQSGAERLRRADRPRARGRAEAGQWLAAAGVVPDQALVSSAARTRRPGRPVADGGGWDLEGTVEDALYEAGPDEALDLIGTCRTTSARCSSSATTRRWPAGRAARRRRGRRRGRHARSAPASRPARWRCSPVDGDWRTSTWRCDWWRGFRTSASRADARDACGAMAIPESTSTGSASTRPG